jgi:hypothetical protein
MIDPSSSFVRLARPARLLMWITCIAFASVWPSSALADDPNQAVTTGIPIVDATLKVLGAIYVLVSTILLILPKTSSLALALARFAADWKGIVPQAAAVKEAKTGAMAAKIKRESSGPPPRESINPPPSTPRGFADVAILVDLSVLVLAGAVAFGFIVTGCKTNAARTACDIVHIVDDGCQTFVQVPLPDGTTEKVPRSAIVRLASETKAARLSGGGAP